MKSTIQGIHQVNVTNDEKSCWSNIYKIFDLYWPEDCKLEVEFLDQERMVTEGLYSLNLMVREVTEGAGCWREVARAHSDQRTRCEACLALALVDRAAMNDRGQTPSVWVLRLEATLDSPLFCNGTGLYKSKWENLSTVLASYRQFNLESMIMTR